MSLGAKFEPIPLGEDDEGDMEPDTSSESEDNSDNESDNDVSNNHDPSTELEIEGDFDRLVDRIKLSQGLSTGMLTKDWDLNMQEQEAQFRDDLRAASGVGKRRGKQKKKDRAYGPTLSYEVKSLLGDGNQAYVDGNIPETIRLMLEVIRIEPRAASPWSVLAQCHDDMGQHQQALQLRIMAAHLRHDEEEWERLAQQSKDLGYSRQALYCLGKLTSLDPTNVNAQWERALLSKELGDFKITRHAFLSILKQIPHDLNILAELRMILIELSDLKTCTKLFKAAFEHYQDLYPTGLGPDSATQEEIPGGGFGYLEVLVLADLLNTTGAYGRAVDVIRQGIRWLQGRSQQRYWDICDDDREYDAPDTVRVIEGGPQPGVFPLDINVRHRLLIARIKMGELEEAKFHAASILAEDILDYAPLFVEIADAYFERELYGEARPIYEMLGAEASTSSLYILLQTAACLRMLNEYREAADVYEYIRGIEPTDNDAKLKLAEIYEILNEPRKALEIVYEVIDSRRRSLIDKTLDSDASRTDQALSSSLFPEGQPAEKTGTSKSTKSRMTTEALKQFELEMEAETIKGHQRLMELYPNIRRDSEPNDDEREWIIQAEKLIEAFRETRQLFSTSRQGFRGLFPKKAKPTKTRNSEADELRFASRLQLELEPGRTTRFENSDIFRGLNFQQWLQLFFRYSFLLCLRGQFASAEELLKHILLSNPFHSTELQDSIRLTLMACAIHAKQPAVVVEQFRKIMTAHQFNNEPLRIFLAGMASGVQMTDAFIVSPLQKALSREMRLSNMVATNPEESQIKWLPKRKRFGQSTTKQDDDDDGDLPDDEIESSKSYQSALFYLVHAYELCPSDPVICMSLAVASLGRAMQRQADNRHNLVAQTMAMLSQYRQTRREEPDGVGEIDYNFGRAFQQIGLFSHAATHYERVLEQASRLDSRRDSLAQEAAFNLAFIYVTTGATSLAKGIYRRWLSI
ncbi:hypothetical protein MIND_00161200 [Mycena indigotica]|uniref:TPR-like protein n=1 Tax=Mycena indigotica TaxID=2126181 RepID=A0A8H6TD65_9AGAR|nr:uncharacterized protein MIND_00161200 [Mycena indigotica]KAF7316423.1 hypothetical protein MIND_00161200 [Mycena indigotica]